MCCRTLLGSHNLAAWLGAFLYFYILLWRPQLSVCVSVCVMAFFTYARLVAATSYAENALPLRQTWPGKWLAFGKRNLR